MTFQSIFTYIVAFLAIYVQVFFLTIFFDKKGKIVRRTSPIDLPTYPEVTVIVPCWNEETTIARTVESLLALDYPHEKLGIFLVDDGSTDNTWNVMQTYTSNPRIKIFHKENGGKHTAMNLGIENSTSEIVSCLDADSFVDPQALKRLVSYLKDPTVMSVAPSIIVDKPKTFMQRIQKVEYNMAVYIKKMLGFVGGIHVTPGPFSIYRREIFQKIGMFRKAHNTEDMEIAYRMQKNHLRIEQCNDAYVYTVSPDTLQKLYKQRLRWIHGFIRNTIDYRKILFQRSYGTFSVFTVPAGMISIITAMTLFSLSVFGLWNKISHKVIQIKTVGVHFSSISHFSWFSINLATTKFLIIILYGLVITGVLIGTRMAEGKTRFPLYTFPYIIVYSLIAPFWLAHAIYKAARMKGTSWR